MTGARDMTGASPVTTIYDRSSCGLPRQFEYSSDTLYGCHAPLFLVMPPLLAFLPVDAYCIMNEKF